jgi:hypothetical protein
MLRWPRVYYIFLWILFCSFLVIISFRIYILLGLCYVSFITAVSVVIVVNSYPQESWLRVSAARQPMTIRVVRAPGIPSSAKPSPLEKGRGFAIPWAQCYM